MTRQKRLGAAAAAIGDCGRGDASLLLAVKIEMRDTARCSIYAVLCALRLSANG